MENGRSVSWAAMATAILIPLVLAMAPYAIKGFVGQPAPAPAPTISPVRSEDLLDIEKRTRVLERAVSDQAYDIREIRAAQERNQKLLVLIARSMGVKVAE